MSAARIVHDEPYCRIVLRDSPRTIVVFSAVNYPAGKFAASRVLENTDCNVVFLNCPHNSWYLEGVPGLGKCPESSAKALLALLAGFGLTEDRRVVWGSSMGGYGAVVYGALLGADVIVASGAVLKLFAPGSLSVKYLKLDGKRADLRPLDVRQLVANARGRFFLYAGEFYYPDLASVRLLMDLPNVSVTTLADFGHWLPNYFDGRYGLQRFVLFHLEEGRGFPFEDGEVGELKKWSGHWDLLDQGALEWMEPQRTELLELAKESTDAVLKVHCRNALSLGATKSGFHKRAILQAEKALKACPGSRHATRRLVLALRKAGAPPAEWLKVATGIRDLNRPDVFEPAVKLLEAMAQAFADSESIGEGVDFLRGLMDMENTAPEMKEWLGKLIEKLSGCRIWKVAFTAEAEAQLSAYVLDESLLHVLGGRSTIQGVVLFPEEWGNPVTFEAENLVIDRHEAKQPSPKIGKLHPDHPGASQARFKLDFLTEDADLATIYARSPDGRRLPVIHFTRVSKNEG
ncbi:MAG: hypothetical protein ABIS50_02055 [Luteolibacter sp.]|uniref:hypothetical protein n=1 Tax=Luteolibacter sp. TaxID=1962973 RepID=UPI0032641A4D